MSRVDKINAHKKELLELENKILGKTITEAEEILNNFTNENCEFIKTNDRYYNYSYVKFDNKFEVVITLKNNKIDFCNIDIDFVGKPEGDEVVVRCYYNRELYRNRDEAMKFYLECMCFSEGSEHQRYCNVCADLRAGKNFAEDGM